MNKTIQAAVYIALATYSLTNASIANATPVDLIYDSDTTISSDISSSADRLYVGKVSEGVNLIINSEGVNNFV